MYINIHLTSSKYSLVMLSIFKLLYNKSIDLFFFNNGNFSILCFSYFKLFLIGFLTIVVQRVQIHNVKKYKYKRKKVKITF